MGEWVSSPNVPTYEQRILHSAYTRVLGQVDWPAGDVPNDDRLQHSGPRVAVPAGLQAPWTGGRGPTGLTADPRGSLGPDFCISDLKDRSKGTQEHLSVDAWAEARINKNNGPG